MHNGLWVVIEGIDGAGKTTALATASAMLQKITDRNVLPSRHPGATPLGQQIRQLVLHHGVEEHLVIDRLSEQLLMLVDHISFKNLMLLSALNSGDVVISDRCNLISGIVYGLANGIDFSSFDHMITLADSPRIDRLYVLRCEWDTLYKRLEAKDGGRDRFESRGVGFLQHVYTLYDQLLIKPAGDFLALLNRIVALENIKLIDSDQSAEEVANIIVEDIQQLLSWK